MMSKVLSKVFKAVDCIVKPIMETVVAIWIYSRGSIPGGVIKEDCHDPLP